MKTKIINSLRFSRADARAFITIILLLILQFGSYFTSKYSVSAIHVVNQPIDEHIPFIKYFVIFYTIWYIMIIVVPFMISRRDRNMFHIYVWTYALMYIAALFTFIFYPTIINIPPLETTDFFTWWMNWIYEIDYPPINCIPSGHTMSCLLMIYCTVLCKKMKASTKSITIIINILTICSAVFTKQHALIDLLFSFIYTTLIFVVVWFVYRKILKKS